MELQWWKTLWDLGQQQHTNQHPPWWAPGEYKPARKHGELSPGLCTHRVSLVQPCPVQYGRLSLANDTIEV